MRLTRTVILALFVSMFSSPAIGAGVAAFGQLPDFTNLVRHRMQAERLAVGCRVALACKKCQGRNIRTVDEKKTFLAWFDTHKTQKCDGCGGSMKLKKARGMRDFTHTCNKCGDNSAAVCAAPAKKK